VSVQYSKPLPIQEIKAAGDGTWEVSGYVSTFGTVDRGGDVVLAGAFDRALDDGRRIKFLYAHQQDQVLGVPLGWKVDDHGLWGRFKISRTRLGEDVHTLLKDGALDSFSIGFFIDDLDFDPETGTRLLKEIDLLEASVVAVPMNPDALVTAVKQLATPDNLRFDEHCELVLSTITGFVARSRDYADLRAGQGRRPLSDAAFERLTSVRTAVDELLSIQAVKRAVEAPPPPTETEPDAPDDAPPGPVDPPRSDLATRMALRRARLRHAGILEMPSDVHDSRRGSV
jgi:hypothetical protein